MGIANFLRTRRDRRSANQLEAEKLIDEAYDLLGIQKGGDFEISDLASRQDAQGLVRRAIRIDGKAHRVLRWQGYLHEVELNPEAARQCYEQLVRVEESKREGYLELGRITTGEESVRFYSLAAECAPGRAAEPLYEIAKVHSQGNDPDRAMKHLRACLAVDGRHANAHYELAQLLVRNGELLGAETHFGRAIEIDQSFVDAMVGLGVLLTFDEERWDEGCEWLRAAMRANPLDDYPHLFMSAVLAKREKAKEAREHYERAVALNPRRRLRGSSTAHLMAEMRKLLEPTLSTEFGAVRGSGATTSPPAAYPEP